MLIRFLPQSKSHKPRRLIETLLPTTHLLVGYPELAIALVESLVFKKAYNFGYLAFEEQNIPDKCKYQIISHFEKTFLAGLSADQYQSCWFEHRDQQRLRLYFFIPTIELTTRKRINLYYDRVDRPLCEAFQHAINLHYGLTASDDPQKRQTHKVGNNIPKRTKTMRDRENDRREIEHSWERFYQQVGRKLQENRQRFTKTT